MGFVAKTDRQLIGALGESLAAIFLERKGYVILGRNYRKPWGEIDLIARQQGTLVFVEVKSVSRETLDMKDSRNDLLHQPQENMHPRKIERLERAIQTYLGEMDAEEMDWRLDLVTVEIDVRRKVGKCEHLEGVYL